MAEQYQLDYQTLFALLPTPAFVLKDTGKDVLLVDFNDSVTRELKSICTTSLNMPIDEIFSDLSNLNTSIQSAFSEKTPFVKELSYRPDSAIKPRYLKFESVFVDPDLLIICVQNIDKSRQVKSELKENKERLELAITATDSGLWDWYLPSGKVIFGDQWAVLLGYDPEEIKPHISSWEKLIHPDDKSLVMDSLNLHLSGESPRYQSEHRLLSKNGNWIWVQDVGKVVEKATDGTPIRMTGTKVDISKHKKMEIEIELQNKDLEKKVEDRTRKLKESREAERFSREEVQKISKHLMEVNNALKVLLKKSDENKKEIEENMLSNTKELIIPYIEKVQGNSLSERQKTYIEIIKTTLNEIVSPFSRTLASKYLNLTPSELTVAYLVKYGKSTKQIASLLCLSEKTIATQRKNIRKKIGINNKKVNLETYLHTYID